MYQYFNSISLKMFARLLPFARQHGNTEKHCNFNKIPRDVADIGSIRRLKKDSWEVQHQTSICWPFVTEIFRSVLFQLNLVNNNVMFLIGSKKLLNEVNKVTFTRRFFSINAIFGYTVLDKQPSATPYSWFLGRRKVLHRCAIDIAVLQ